MNKKNIHNFIMDRLDSPVSVNCYSLSGGASGIALYFATLYTVYGDENYKVLAEEYIEKSLNLLNNSDVVLSFYRGFSGAIWAIEKSCKLIDKQIDEDFSTDFDNLLIDYYKRPIGQIEFDLINGLTGILLYSLSRNASKQQIELTSVLLDCLFKSASHEEEIVYWLHPENGFINNPETGFDIGVAHGLPGVIAVLSQASKINQDVEHIIKKGINALDSSLIFKDSLGYFGYNNKSKNIARQAWCYGNPGIAVALSVVNSSMGQELLSEMRIDIAGLILSSLKTKDEHRGINDHCLCHGDIGYYVVLGFALDNLIESNYHTSYDLNEIRSQIEINSEKTLDNIISNLEDELSKSYWEPSESKFIESKTLLEGLLGIGFGSLALDKATENSWASSMILKKI